MKNYSEQERRLFAVAMDSIDLAAECIPYVGEYLQQKWHLPEELQALRERLGALEVEMEP